jgi:hypothetical protein
MPNHWRPPPPKLPEHLNQEQRDGLACVHCGQQNRPMQPVEAWSNLRIQLFECIDTDACADLMGQPPES